MDAILFYYLMSLSACANEIEPSSFWTKIIGMYQLFLKYKCKRKFPSKPKTLLGIIISVIADCCSYLDLVFLKWTIHNTAGRLMYNIWYHLAYKLCYLHFDWRSNMVKCPSVRLGSTSKCFSILAQIGSVLCDTDSRGKTKSPE